MKNIAVVIALAGLSSGCADEPVVWRSVRYAGAPAPLQQTTSPLELPGRSPCRGSVRTVRSGGESFAAWWDVKPDSSAALLVARSPNATTGWQSPVAADTSDRSARGCNRPAPSITADPRKGYVYVAYFAEPKGSPGIFFVHSMDNGQTFHAPFPVVYGRNPAKTGIAARGERVVVAYEDPNSTYARVAVALSNTEGHLFEKRADASGSNARATGPLVDLRGDTIRLWWTDRSPNPQIKETRIGYREGIWK